MKTSTFLLVGAFLGSLLISAPVSASVINVTPGNMDGWAFSNMDNAPFTNASGAMVTGPGTPPLGTGSAQFIVGDANSSEILRQIFSPSSYLTLNTTNLTALSYETYVITSTLGSGSAPTLDFDLYNSAAQYQGRLVFDPGLLLTVTDGTWQSWNTLAADAWYFTGYNGNGLNNDCSIANSADYCTFATASSYITNDFAVDMLFKAGSGQNSFDGNVDDLVFNSQTFNFDPNPVPEPITLSIFGAGLAGLAAIRHRKKSKQV
jgi:hypothetical protein